MFGAPASRRDFLKVGVAAALAGGGVIPARAAVDSSRIALVVGNDAYSRRRSAMQSTMPRPSALCWSALDSSLRSRPTSIGMRYARRRRPSPPWRAPAKQRRCVFYYAGHGAQMDWRNFLVPVDARIDTAADLPAQCLELNGLLNDLSKAKGKVFVLILDACRDNPFGTGFQPAQKGLSQFDAPVGSLLAFSTSPGSVAVDSMSGVGASGVNGLYTGNLVRELSVKGVRLEDALKRVRLAVRVASHGAQVPWESTSLESDVFVFPAATSKLSGSGARSGIRARDRHMESDQGVEASRRIGSAICAITRAESSTKSLRTGSTTCCAPRRSVARSPSPCWSHRGRQRRRWRRRGSQQRAPGRNSRSVPGFPFLS